MSNAEFYNKDYYAGHYAHVVANDKDYQFLAAFWRHAIFELQGLNIDGVVLDYGCGMGQVSAALPNVSLFDVSDVAINFVKQKLAHRPIYQEREKLPQQAFDYILSSHSLEHSSHPAADLREFHRYVKPGGELVLIVPVEQDHQPRLTGDDNQHFQCWTFQTITNLLLHTHWKPRLQTMLYGPYALRTLGRRFSTPRAVKFAQWAGRRKGNFPALLTIATSAPETRGA